MKHKIILLLFVIPIVVDAQEPKEFRLSLGYYGETLSHPGLNIGIEYGVPNNRKEQMILSLNIGGYLHKKNNTSLFVKAHWAQRYNFNKGLFFEGAMGIGYLHHIAHGGDKFEVKPNGAIVQVKKYGNPMLMPSVGLGLGWNFFSAHQNRRLSVFVKPELFWKAPFNGYFLTHFAMNGGVIFNLYKNEK